MSEFRYLTKEDIVAYHAADFLRRGLSPAPIISEEKLQAALERPQASAFGEEAYPALAEKAAALLQSFVIGHPFVDGNKRAGLGARLLFLELNGVVMRAEQVPLVDLVLQVGTGETREVAEVAARLRELFAPELDER